MLHQFPEHLYHLNQTIHFVLFESLSVEVKSSSSPRFAGSYPAAPRRAPPRWFCSQGWKPLAPMETRRRRISITCRMSNTFCPAGPQI